MGGTCSSSLSLVVGIYMINIISSITGFHNPIKHKGLSPQEFLLLYIRRQATKYYNNPSSINENRLAIVITVLSQWNLWIERVKSYFPDTLSVDLTILKAHSP